MTTYGNTLLFVVGPEVSRNDLESACRNRTFKRVLFVSPYDFFPAERVALQQAVSSEAEFLSFADLLDDAAMAAIDDATTAKLRSSWLPVGSYVDAFQSRMTYLKNVIVREIIWERYPVSTHFFAAGLGIDPDAWRRGGIPLHQKQDLGIRKFSGIRRWLANRRKQSNPPTDVTLIDDGESTGLIVGTLRRLPLIPGAVIKKSTWSTALASRPLYIASTIHDHHPIIWRTGLPVRVFVDGLLPSNYSRSYIDAYGPAEFVCPEPFSARWFQSHGFKTRKPPPCIRPAAAIGPATIPQSLRTVIVLLGHSGDWSAHINRSDTDRLVMACLDTAAQTPNTRWIFRMHPTMDHPNHDGPGGTARIGAAVQASSLPNVSISSESLATDLDRGDLFICEYSATLIDAWRRGRLGLIVNLTGRRSFMQDFSDLGFAQLAPGTSLVDELARIADNLPAFARAQSEAAHRYNNLLAHYLSS